MTTAKNIASHLKRNTLYHTQYTVSKQKENNCIISKIKIGNNGRTKESQKNMEVTAVPVVFRVVTVLQVYPFCFKLGYLFALHPNHSFPFTGLFVCLFVFKTLFDTERNPVSKTTKKIK